MAGWSSMRCDAEGLLSLSGSSSSARARREDTLDRESTWQAQSDDTTASSPVAHSRAPTSGDVSSHCVPEESTESEEKAQRKIGKQAANIKGEALRVEFPLCGPSPPQQCSRLGSPPIRRSEGSAARGRTGRVCTRSSIATRHQPRRDDARRHTHARTPNTHRHSSMSGRFATYLVEVSSASSSTASQTPLATKRLLTYPPPLSLSLSVSLARPPTAKPNPNPNSQNHAKVAGVVLPASVLFGFGYTLAFGTSPLPEGVVPSSTTTAPSTSTTTTNNASAPPLHGFSMRLSLGGDDKA